MTSDGLTALLVVCGAGDRDRTGTGLAAHGILSPLQDSVLLDDRLTPLMAFPCPMHRFGMLVL